MKPKYIFLGTLFTLFIASYFLYQDLLTIDAAKKLYPNVSEITKEYSMHIAFVFCLTFILGVFLCLPVTALLSIVAGMIFPEPHAMIFVVVSATMGSLFLYEWISYLYSPYGYQKEAQRLAKVQELISPYTRPLEARFRKRPWAYLLFFRMVPLFPFWIVSMAPAVFKVRFNTFAWTTFLGMIPGAYFFTRAGMGIHNALSIQGRAELIHFLSDEMILSAAGIFMMVALAITLKSRYQPHGKDTV